MYASSVVSHARQALCASTIFVVRIAIQPWVTLHASLVFAAVSVVNTQALATVRPIASSFSEGSLSV
jgi:hypothetical protein